MVSARFHENSVGESDEWFTPLEIFTALGLTFDLDPAHPGIGTPHCHVPARRVFTALDDGLTQPWAGLVWLNMPFGGRNGHVPWLRKFFAHGCGIALVRAYTSAGWWHQEMQAAEVVLFPRGKTKFIRPDGSIGTQPGHGVALIGMGTVACQALQRSGLGTIWDQRSKQEVTMEKPKLQAVEEIAPASDTEAAAPIAKPTAFNLDKFKSKRAAAMANVETLLTALPAHSIIAGKGFRAAAP